MVSANEERRALVAVLFPEGIPELWCPPITQYDERGSLDEERTRKHLSFLCENIRTFLLFGSTGDGWELSLEEKKKMLLFYGKEAAHLHFKMLIGVLEPEKGAAARGIREWIAWMKAVTGRDNGPDAMKALHVCGFTVCAPRGRNLAECEIKEELERILTLGYPTVLYQLPQITLNEISPETVAELAMKYSNFYMFKDTSGKDQVKLSKKDFGNVFFVRGAEGDYEKWSYRSGGCYDGFLLSSANTFGRELRFVLEALQAGELNEAKRSAGMISEIIGKVFSDTAELEGGNVFANANKCIDHILAYGERWDESDTPMRHCGKRIPEKYIESTYAVMKKFGKIPDEGYCMKR